MSLSWIQGQELVRDVRPILEQRDAAALVRHLERYWPADRLAELLGCGNADAEKTALVCLAMTGSMAHGARVARVLHSSDPAAVGFAEYALWSIWLRAGDDEANASLHAAVQLIGEECLELAVERLTELIARCPRFAEAYNQRAIALFLQGEYAQAAEDCTRTLRLNPYHFGALAGLGHCHAAQGRLESAFNAYLATLQLHPRLEGIRQSLQQIEQGLHKHVLAEGPRQSDFS